MKKGRIGVEGGTSHLINSSAPSHESDVLATQTPTFDASNEGFERSKKTHQRSLTRSEGAKRAYDAQISQGDHSCSDWQEKVAQANAHDDIAGTFAGCGPGDIVHRFHEGLHTASTVIRSVDVDQEAFAALEYGAAPAPVSFERTQSILDKEWSRLDELGNAQVEKNLRSAPGQPLIKDRKLFVLGRTAAIDAAGGGVWLGLKRKTDTIYVHAKIAPGDYRAQKEAIEMLGVNLVHAAYFREPLSLEHLKSSLVEGAPKGILELDFLSFGAERFAPNGVPRPDPPRAKHALEVLGHDADALKKAEALVKHGDLVGSVSEIGGAQLVADLFERTVGSENTVVSKNSNYGMEMSAHLYGATPRSVSSTRLSAMLDTEYAALFARAEALKLPSTQRRFAYANTVATKANGPGAGWLGIDFQATPGGPKNRIALHLRMMSKDVPEQELALKTIGVNLIHAALTESGAARDVFLKSLLEGVPPGSVEIDAVECSGKALEHWQPEELPIRLLERRRAEALVYPAQGNGPVPPADHFFKRTYKVTHDRADERGTLVLVDLARFQQYGKVDVEKVLARIAELNREGADVLVTRRPALEQIVELLAGSANEHDAIVATRGELRRLFDPKTWTKHPRGMTEVLESLAKSDPPKLTITVPPGPDLEIRSKEGQRLYALLSEKKIII